MAPWASACRVLSAAQRRSLADHRVRSTGCFLGRRGIRKLVVTENVTLDGVMQAPGRPGEDTRGGFSHVGWALPYHDAAKAAAMGGGVAQARALLPAGGPTRTSTRSGRYARTTRSPPS